jgi:hypothetical protein
MLGDSHCTAAMPTGEREGCTALVGTAAHALSHKFINGTHLGHNTLVPPLHLSTCCAAGQAHLDAELTLSKHTCRMLHVLHAYAHAQATVCVTSLWKCLGAYHLILNAKPSIGAQSVK